MGNRGWEEGPVAGVGRLCVGWAPGSRRPFVRPRQPGALFPVPPREKSLLRGARGPRSEGGGSFHRWPPPRSPLSSSHHQVGRVVEGDLLNVTSWRPFLEIATLSCHALSEFGIYISGCNFG